MKFKILEEPRIVMSNPLSKHNYFAWPTIARLKNGTLALAASGWRLRHVCPFGKVVMIQSEDEGKTWSAPAVVLDTVLDDRDAGLCPFGESGLMVTSFNNTREFQRFRLKRDGKVDPYTEAYLQTVSDEEEAAFLGVLYRVSLDNGKTFGPIYKSPVSSPHGPTQLSDGTLLWVGRAFSAPGTRSPIQAYAITPDGKTEFRGEIPEGDPSDFPCEPHAIQLPDGRVLCHFRVQRRDENNTTVKLSICQTESADGGRTWTKPVQLIEDLSGAPPHLVRLADGTLVCTYSHRRSPFGIWFMASRDEGRTWSCDHHLLENGEGWDLGYPSTVELADGSLLTAYYAHETADAPAVIWQVRWKLYEV